MPSVNRIILASAGSGKTTDIVQEACGDPHVRSALITYTINGRGELSDKAYEHFGAIPLNVSIGTWYSFVLTHLVRPYQNKLYTPRISTINFGRIPIHLRKIKKADTQRYFFSSSSRIWRDRVTDFACQVIKETDGLPLRRIERIFRRIYIDEAQDLSGWDLDLVEHLLNTSTDMVLVGDHRQATYSTNDNPKNKAYWGEEIVRKFDEWEKAGLVEIKHLAISRRCNQAICEFADRLFPTSPKAKSLNVEATGHDGVFLVAAYDLIRYCEKFSPKPLRYDKRTVVMRGKPVNFGGAKGMTFDRIVIYPHGKFLKYLQTGRLELKGRSLTRTYVAITRARNSVAIVVPNGFKSGLLPFYTFPD